MVDVKEGPTLLAPSYRSVWCELLSPEDGYVSGWGVILPGADIAEEALLAALRDYHGDDVESYISDVQHLHFMPRVKWCSNYDGWGCDNEGEWHGHWLSVKHNDAAADCCYTLALPHTPYGDSRTSNRATGASRRVGSCDE